MGLHFGQISLNRAPKMNAIDEVDSEKKKNETVKLTKEKRKMYVGMGVLTQKWKCEVFYCDCRLPRGCVTSV